MHSRRRKSRPETCFSLLIRFLNPKCLIAVGGIFCLCSGMPLDTACFLRQAPATPPATDIASVNLASFPFTCGDEPSGPVWTSAKPPYRAIDPHRWLPGACLSEQIGFPSTNPEHFSHLIPKNFPPTIDHLYLQPQRAPPSC